MSKINKKHTTYSATFKFTELLELLGLEKDASVESISITNPNNWIAHMVYLNEPKKDVIVFEWKQYD